MQDPQEKYVPRLIKQNEEVNKGWHQAIKDWADQKLKYKSFRLKIFKEFGEMKNPNNQLEIKTLDRLILYMTLNAFIITAIVTRKQGAFAMISKSVAVSSFSYLSVTLYGEEKIFHQNCLREDLVGFYLRTKYLEEMGEHTHSDIYRRMNDTLITKIKGPEDTELKDIIKRYENNIKKSGKK